MTTADESLAIFDALKASDLDGCLKCVITLPGGETRENADGWASGRSGGLETMDAQLVPTANRVIYMAALKGLTAQELEGALIETRAVLPPSAIESLRIVSVHE